MTCFFIPQLPAFSSTLWGFPVINYGLGGLWPFAVLQLWWPLSCWNICVLVWRFSLVSLVPSSLLTLLSFWNSCLDLGPQNCSSYFIFFTFLLFLFSTFGEFSCIFLLLYCCVCGWMGAIVLPFSATTLRVLCAPSEWVHAAFASVLLCRLDDWIFFSSMYISIFLKLLFCFCHFSSGTQWLYLWFTKKLGSAKDSEYEQGVARNRAPNSQQWLKSLSWPLYIKLIL